MTSADDVPPNLLLNPRAKAINLDPVPIQPQTSTPSNRFTPEEEASLLSEARTHKTHGNTQFTATPPDYDSAISSYREALKVCPKYLGQERAVYYANIAAAFLKLEKWKDAEEAATSSLVESGDEKPQVSSGAINGKDEGGDKNGKGDEVDKEEQKNKEEAVEEIRRDDVVANWKARLRRAKAREMVGSWSSLQDALDDYKILCKIQTLPPIDAKTVKQALVRLPAKIDQKKEQEVGEMMGKLKGLGDGILRPFGLSTDNFQMQKDEKTGGYSMNFKR